MVVNAHTWRHGKIGRANGQALTADSVEQAISRSAIGDGEPLARRAECDGGRLGQPRDDGEALIEPAE